MSGASDLVPDRAAMLRHAELVFGGGCDGAIDGLVELAWTDPATGKLSHAQLFGTDQLEDLVERAAALNRAEGCNVYLGAALRKPGTPVDRRSTDAAFHAAPFAWADIDADCVGEAIRRAKAAGVAPAMAVVTGVIPHMRAQLWWRLAEACRDPEALRALCATIALALGGDGSVANPGRVLRLGGSLAWPVKPGRVLELTQVHIPADDRPRAYWPAALQVALGRQLPPQSQAPRQSPQPASAPDAPPVAPPAPPPSLAIGGVSGEAALAAIRSGHRWHDQAVRLIAHWVGRGWSDAEILLAAEGLTLPGWTVADTRRDALAMIAGARRKWNVPDPAIAIDDTPAPPEITIDWEDGSGAAMIPRRRWLIGSFALRGALTVLVAPPGAGKSTLGIALAVAAATGRGEIAGEAVHETVKAWFWNNEDDKPELRRRLAAVMRQWDVAPGDLRGRLGLNSGAANPLVVARATRDGAVLRLPAFAAVIDRVRADGIGLLIVDPFVETHEADENDNVQIKAVAAMWRDVARLCDCAVVLVHHTGKPPPASPDGWAGSLSASRGASSLAGVARIMRTLFAMSQSDAGKLGLSDNDRRLWVRLDDAKANLSLVSGAARWFRRVSVTIANGEEVGVLVPGEPDDHASAEDRAGEIEEALFEAIRNAWNAGAPLSEQPRARDRYAPGVVGKSLSIAPDAVAGVLARLMSEGAIERALLSSKTKSHGLRIVPLDERQGRDAARKLPSGEALE